MENNTVNLNNKNIFKDIISLHNDIKMKKFMLFAYMVLSDDKYIKTSEGIESKKELKRLDLYLKNMMTDLDQDDYIDIIDIMSIYDDIFNNKMFITRLFIYNITRLTKDIDTRIRVFKNYIDKFDLSTIAV